MPEISAMLKQLFTGLGAILALCLNVNAFAGNAPAPPPPKAARLDVTMTVVPLNADIEKTVAQTINIPVPGVIPATQKPAATAKHAAPRQDKAGIKSLEHTRASAIRESAKAQREAAEAAKEARKDSSNSGAPDNDTPP